MATDVLHYVKATAVIYFEENHAACRYCPLLETYSRDQCRRTGEYILDRNGIGYDCPLDWEGANDELQNADG